MKIARLIFCFFIALGFAVLVLSPFVLAPVITAEAAHEAPLVRALPPPGPGEP